MIDFKNVAVKMNGLSHPTHILTDLGDREFLEKVFSVLPHSFERECETGLDDIFLVSDIDAFLKVGIVIDDMLNSTPGRVLLFKLGDGIWAVRDYAPEEMEKFVAILNGENKVVKSVLKTKNDLFLAHFQLAIVGIVAILALFAAGFYALLGGLGLMGDNSPVCIFATSACYEPGLWFLASFGELVVFAGFVALFSKLLFVYFGKTLKWYIVQDTNLDI